jgi:peroxiredoxin
MRNILIGSRVPEVQFGQLVDGEVRCISASEVFAYHRAVVIGVPGAFTPVCTKQHIPDFIKNVDRLNASGFSQLVCIAPNDPFVLAEWARIVDPETKLLFLSDGNLDFTRALGMECSNRPLFLGCRSERYMLIVDDGTITRLRVEPNILTFSCSRAEDVADVAMV